MKRKLVFILFVAMVLVSGCGIKGEYLNITPTNDFLGTWYSLESWSGSYDGVSDQYVGKYVFDENTVKFYTYGVSSSSSWTLRNSYSCTYSYDYGYHSYNGSYSNVFYTKSCTFNGSSYSNFDSSSIHYISGGSTSVKTISLDDKKYTKLEQSSEITPTNEFLGTWQYYDYGADCWQVSSTPDYNSKTYSYVYRMGKYEFTRTSVKYYTRDYTLSSSSSYPSYPSSSAFSSISWTLDNTYTPTYSCKLYGNDSSSTSDSSYVYRVKSCTLNGNNTLTVQGSSSSNPYFNDNNNRRFYKQ